MKKIALLTFASLCLCAPASAETAGDAVLEQASFAEEIGAAERIESGASLRIYSQELAAAACFFHNGIDVELSKKLLQEAQAGFDLHYSALRDGNDALGIIGGEERRKTIVKLDAIQPIWDQMDQAVDTLLADQTNKEAIGVIKDQNVPLLEVSDLLLSELQGEYANPVQLMMTDVLMLEIAGRQSLTTQKIAKNACKLLSGRDTAAVRTDLTEAIALYELSLNALLNGMPDIGLQPAPTEEIAEGLRTVQADWAKTRPVVDKIIDGSHDEEALTYLFEHMVDEMYKLSEITHQYVVFSKHEY